MDRLEHDANTNMDIRREYIRELTRRGDARGRLLELSIEPSKEAWSDEGIQNLDLRLHQAMVSTAIYIATQTEARPPTPLNVPLPKLNKRCHGLARQRPHQTHTWTVGTRMGA